MTTTSVSGGPPVSGLVLNSTDTLIVLDGGTALATTVNAGGVVTISSGGYTASTILHASGLEQVLVGGGVSGTVVSSGGSEVLGGTAVSTSLGIGAVQEILSGGTAVATSASLYAVQLVSGGGTAISTTLADAAAEVVSSGGVTRYTVLSSLASETVAASGLAVSTIIGAPGSILGGAGELFVASGGFAVGAVISSGFLANAGVTVDTVVLSGGIEYVSAATLTPVSGQFAVVPGGTAIGTVLDAGGTLVVQSGGVTAGGITFNGPDAFLDLSGTVMPAATISGFAATDTIDLINIPYDSGGSATYASGVLTVSEGGQTYAITLAGTYAASGFSLYGAGSSTEVFLDTGSGVVVTAGYPVSDLVLDSTDRLAVLSGATALGITVNAGAVATISSGGYASGTILHTQGIEQVLTGATVSGTVVSSGGSEALAGTGFGTIIDRAGTQAILGGGTALGTTATDFGTQIVSGGTAISTILADNAGEVVYSGGVTRYTVLSSLASETVSIGGLAVSTIVGPDGPSTEGELIVASGGTAAGAVISSGFLANAGVTIDTVVLSGGIEYVSAATLVPVSGQFAVVPGGTAIGTVLDAGGTLVLQSGAVASGGIAFNGSGAFLDISATVMPATPISGFAPTDRIDLINIPYGSGGSATYTSGVLTVSEGGQSYDLTLAGTYTGASFTLLDAGSSTEIGVANLPCFAAGTRIRTDRGEVAIEALARGKWVLTAGRGPLPIRWIGHRTVDCRRHPRPAAVLPVRIRAHAFAPNQPSRDLFLSPDHAIFTEGVLIPVKHLINGDSLRQLPVDSVTYFHIELPGHAVIYAEGLPAESYLDTGDRASFWSDGPIRLHPVFGSELQDIALAMEALACAPFRVVGPEVDRVRRTLAARLSGPDPSPARTRSTSGPVTRNGA
jgi:autotransporter passenger strand-loop-strand repeat protein